MREDSVVEYRNPGISLPVADALTEVLRSGARELLQQAVGRSSLRAIVS